MKKQKSLKAIYGGPWVCSSCGGPVGKDGIKRRYAGKKWALCGKCRESA